MKAPVDDVLLAGVSSLNSVVRLMRGVFDLVCRMVVVGWGVGGVCLFDVVRGLVAVVGVVAVHLREVFLRG